MKKYMIGILTGIIITCGVGYCLANILISSKDVSFSSTKTTKTNVGDALDELFDKVENSPNISLNGGEPVIKGNLIPVIIKNDGTVYKADTSKVWYNYAKKWWANAIELKSGVTDNYNPGDRIYDSEIRSYFVWIPKYRYKLWNVNKDGNSAGAIGPHSIEIEFNQENTSDVEGVSCATPMTSNGSGNCDNGEWMTHPAFISMGITGFWVGKFEIGHKDNTTAKAKASMNPASDAPNIVVKPDYYSWTSTSAANYFNTLLNYNSALESHMMKNTEWGAVAYLSHSEYGIGTEININNYTNNTTNWYIKTGYSANPSTDQHTYQGTIGTNNNSLWNTKNGFRASTTGNISGIYDMSGGTQEYMASFRIGVTDITSADAKYYDVYGASGSYTDYKYRILGDATGEMGPFNYYKDGDGISRQHNWYGDFSHFVYSSLPWFVRGGYPNGGALAGVFDFYYIAGTSYADVGSRLVLSPTK